MSPVKKAAVKKAAAKKGAVKTGALKKAAAKHPTASAAKVPTTATGKAAARTAAPPSAPAVPGGVGPFGWAIAPRAAGERRYWLVKSEPDVFSFDDLLAAPGRTTCWDGVRNYTARNLMRDGMRVGDLVLYYHSNAEPSGVVGVAEVVREAYPDHTQFDPAHDHYDPASKPEAPAWLMVDVRAVEKLPAMVTLEQMRGDPALEGLETVRKGSRLSVHPVSVDHFDHVRRREA